MTVLGKGLLTPPIGTMVMDNLYPVPPTSEKVMKCPASLILTRSCRPSKVCHRKLCYSIQPLTVISDRIAETFSATSTLKIRIPASVDKRKRCTDKSLLSEAEPEDTPSKKKKTKSSAPTQTPKQSIPVKGAEDDSDDSLPNTITKQVKKRRGRPKAAKVAHANRDFLVPVYLEIAQEPVLTRGKTHKGDKFVKQPPITDGPFHLTRRTTWEKFRREVADIAGIDSDSDKENFSAICKGLKWSFQKKSPLPLKDETGFRTLMLQIKAMKDPNSAIIIVSLPPLARSGHKARESEVNVSTDTQHDSTMYGKKVGLLIYKLRRDVGWADRFEFQISLDDQLAPIISTLEETHPIGLSNSLEHSLLCSTAPRMAF